VDWRRECGYPAPGWAQRASEIELRRAYANWQPIKPRPVRQRACGAGLIEELEFNGANVALRPYSSPLLAAPVRVERLVAKSEAV
jgi:hypothetical protein